MVRVKSDEDGEELTIQGLKLCYSNCGVWDGNFGVDECGGVLLIPKKRVEPV